MHTENITLRIQVRDLTQRYATLQTELDTVKAELAEVRASPPPQQHLARGWHQYANGIIGAENSRSAPSHTYKCALAH